MSMARSLTRQWLSSSGAASGKARRLRVMHWSLGWSGDISGDIWRLHLGLNFCVIFTALDFINGRFQITSCDYIIGPRSGPPAAIVRFRLCGLGLRTHDDFQPGFQRLSALGCSIGAKLVWSWFDLWITPKQTTYFQLIRNKLVGSFYSLPLGLPHDQSPLAQEYLSRLLGQERWQTESAARLPLRSGAFAMGDAQSEDFGGSDWGSTRPSGGHTKDYGKSPFSIGNYGTSPCTLRRTMRFCLYGPRD